MPSSKVPGNGTSVSRTATGTEFAPFWPAALFRCRPDLPRYVANPLFADHERGYPSQVRRDDHQLCLWNRLPHPLHPARNQDRHLRRLPPVLYRGGQVRRYGGPNRKILASLRLDWRYPASQKSLASQPKTSRTVKARDSVFTV